MILSLKSIRWVVAVFAVLWFSRSFNFFLEDFSDGRGYSGPSAIFQILSLMLYLCSAWMMFIKRQWVKRCLLRNPLPVLFVGLCFLTYFWSFDPDVTLRRSVAALGMLAAGLLLAYVVEERGSINTIYIPLLVGMFASYFLVIFIPSVGIASGQLVPSHNGLWQGIYGFKNALGQIMAILSIFLIAQLKSRFYVLSLILALLMLLMTKSTSAILSFLCAISFWYLLRLYKFKYKALFAFILVTFFVVVLIVFINIEYIVYDVIGKDFTASGRVDIWEQVLAAAKDRPLGFGYGGVFWGETSAAYNYMDDFYTTLGHSHNGFVDSKLELGNLGLLLYILAIIFPLYRYCALYRKGDQVLESKIMLLVFLLVYSLSGSGWFRPNTLLFLIYFYCSFSGSLRRHV